MKTNSKNKIISTLVKRFLATLILGIGLTTSANAQMFCNAAFTYTVGSSGQVSFTNTSTGVLGTPKYYWNFGFNGNVDTAASPSQTYPFNGAYTVFFSVTDSLNNCYSTSTQTVTITNAQPAPPCQPAFTYTTGSNGQVNFTNTSSTYTGSTTYYDWNFGDGSQDYTFSPSYTYYYNGTYTVSLNVYNSYSSCSNVSSQVITISNANPIPACNSSFTYTLGTAGQVSCASSYTGNPNGVFWYFGNGASMQGNPISYTYPYNGVYTLTCTINDSMINCFSSSSNTFTITNTATLPCLPTASFSMHQDSLNTGVGLWDVYPNYSSQVSSAVWTWGDGSSTAGLYPTHTYASAGWYTICVKVYSQCGDSSTTCQADSVYRMAHNSNAASMVTVNVINTSAGIKNNTNNMTSIKAYPNPFTDDLTVNFTSYENNTLTYTIFDMMGNQILKENVSVHNGDNEFKINTNVMDKGVYFLNIVGNNGKKASTLKIVK